MAAKVLLLPLLVAILGYIYVKWDLASTDELNRQEDNIIAAWDKFIKLPGLKFKRIAVGINSNIDLIVPAILLFEALNISPGKQKNHHQIQSLENLQETFSHFFSKGSAAERTFQNGKLFQEVVEVAQGLPDIQYHLGGNAMLMASKVSELFPNIEIQYVGPVGPKLIALMSQAIKVPMKSHIPQDETHLIMEYRVGDKWGELVAPVANRFITSYDESNSKATMLENFFESLESFHPDLILFSGLHLLDAQEAVVFSERVETMMKCLAYIPLKVPIHLELASMVNKQFIQQILEKVIPYVNSFGLNEQEAAFISEVGGGPYSDFSQNNSPEIYKVTEIILWFLKEYGYSRTRQGSRLTRVHFHSLTYHLVGTVREAWDNGKSAVAAGTRMAALQACNVDKLDSEQVELKIPKTFKIHSKHPEVHFNEKQPVMSWDLEGYHFVFSPVLVCKKPVKTVGLGDAISATGLVYSEFSSSYRS